MKLVLLLLCLLPSLAQATNLEELTHGNWLVEPNGLVYLYDWQADLHVPVGPGPRPTLADIEVTPTPTGIQYTLPALSGLTHEEGFDGYLYLGVSVQVYDSHNTWLAPGPIAASGWQQTHEVHTDTDQSLFGDFFPYGLGGFVAAGAFPLYDSILIGTEGLCQSCAWHPNPYETPFSLPWQTIETTIQPMPEPGTWLLFATGFAGLTGFRYQTVIKRFVLFLFMFISGYFVSVLGWKYIDNKRTVVGATLVLGGLFLTLAGLSCFLFW